MEADGKTVDQQRFPGRQGRIVFAYLAVQEGRAVPRDELAELLWGDELPATWGKALRVLMTKLRAVLEECGIDGSTALTSAFGCYTLALPADAWIDVHAAARSVEQAEAAFAAGDLEQARAQAGAAEAFSRPTFLPGEDGPWVEDQRRALHDLLVRALECLRDASFAAGRFGDALRYATEITELEPFRESSSRALMQAHVAAGDPAEALRVYERYRRFLADELGAFPSAESEAVYLEILRASSGTPVGADDRREEARLETEPPPPPTDEPPRRSRRLSVALAIGALVVVIVATAAGLGFSSRDKPPVRILPNSLVRLDPVTLKPTKVIPIGPKADLVVVSGGYAWVTHRILRYTNNEGRRQAGDRKVTRVNPETDETDTVGGLAPCGITPDPSGDVWVGDCPSAGRYANVTRVDAETEKFEEIRHVPAEPGYYRGMTTGGGSLWVAPVSGSSDDGRWRRLTRFDLQTGKRSSILLARHATALAWSTGYDDLWMTNFGDGSVSQRHTASGAVRATAVTNSPAAVVVKDNGVWVAHWNSPKVTRVPAAGPGLPEVISLPVRARQAGVTQIAAGDGAIWATVPDAHAVIRIDPKSYRTRAIPLRYAPWGVAVDEHGAIWVALRWRKTYVSS